MLLDLTPSTPDARAKDTVFIIATEVRVIFHFAWPLSVEWEVEAPFRLLFQAAKCSAHSGKLKTKISEPKESKRHKLCVVSWNVGS